jgi:hypothetical protein
MGKQQLAYQKEHIYSTLYVCYHTDCLAKGWHSASNP